MSKIFNTKTIYICDRNFESTYPQTLLLNFDFFQKYYKKSNFWDVACFERSLTGRYLANQARITRWLKMRFVLPVVNWAGPKRTLNRTEIYYIGSLPIRIFRKYISINKRTKILYSANTFKLSGKLFSQIRLINSP